jgi:hypothetical protein
MISPSVPFAEDMVFRPCLPMGPRMN